MNRRSVDAVLFVGDISGDGHPEEFDAFDGVVSELNAPMYVIPGNHDVPKTDNNDQLAFGAFERRYAPGGYPAVHSIGDLPLVALNSAGTDEWLRDTHDGYVTDAHLEWLGETLDGLADPIVAVHHNLPGITAQYRAHLETFVPEVVEDAIAPVMQDAGTFVDAMAAHDVPLVLTGHLHYPAYAETRGVPEITAPSTGPGFPRAYLLVDVGPEGTMVRMIPVVDYTAQRDALVERVQSGPGTRTKVFISSLTMAQAPFGTGADGHP